MKQYILKAIAISTLVAISATNAIASNTPRATILEIQRFAPEASVAQLNHRQVASLMNVISSGDDSDFEKAGTVKSLIERFEKGVFSD
jgi:uncharacterized MAPEG superfamily protein